MKIAVTITDAGMALNVGGPVESETAFIEMTDDQIPRILRDHLAARKRIRETVKDGRANVPYLCQSVTFSLVSEE